MDSNVHEDLNQSMFIFEEDEELETNVNPIVEEKEQEEEEKDVKDIATKSNNEDQKSKQVPNIVDPISVIKEDVKVETGQSISTTIESSNHNKNSNEDDSVVCNDELNDSISDFIPFLEQFDEVQKDKQVEKDEEIGDSDHKSFDDNQAFEKPPPMVGFSTANGKPVTFSKAALDRIKNMWDGEDLDFIPNFPTFNKPSVFTTPKSSSTAKQDRTNNNNENGHNYQMEEKQEEEEEEEEEEDNVDNDEKEKKQELETSRSSIVKSFTSPASESLSNGNFSRNTIERVKNMFKDEDIDIDKPIFMTATSNAYTTTPTLINRPLPIQNSTLKPFGLSKVKRKSAPNLSTTPSSSSYRSFGLSKKSNLSEGSLKYVKNNFNKINNTNDHSKLTSPFRVPMKISPKNTTNNATSPFYINQHNPSTTTVNDSYTNGSTKSSIELSTASGKPVPISHSALAKVKNMWRQEEVEDSNDAEVPTLPMKTEMIVNTAVDVSSSKINQIEFDEDEGSKSPLLTPSSLSASTPPPKQQQFGFSTANGKPVQVSKEALNRVRNLWNEFEEEQQETNREEEHEGGRKIQVPLMKTPSFGFSTGNGKPVQVSKEALNRVKNMWKDEFEEEQQNTSFNNDQIHIQESTTINEEMKQPNKFQSPVIKAQTINEEMKQPNKFQSPVIKAQTIKTPSFGFSTGSGKAVKVSEEALNRVKNMWKDEFEDSREQENISVNKFKSPVIEAQTIKTPSFGFSTGSGKAVKVSEEALNRVKNMWKDEFEEEKQKEQNNNEEEVAKDRENNFESPLIQSPVISTSCGFSTANGKCVTISESALHKVKNMFKEDEENLNIDDISPIKSLKRGRHLLEDDNKFITPAKSARLSIFPRITTNTSTPRSYNTVNTPNSSVLNDMTASQINEIDELSKDCLADDESGSCFLLDGVQEKQYEPMDIDKDKVATAETTERIQRQSEVNNNDENEAETVPVPFNDIPVKRDKTTNEIPLIHGVIVRTYPLCYFCKQDPDGKSGFISRSRFEKIQNENEEKRQELSERLLTEVTKEFENNKNKSAALRRKSIGKRTRRLEELPTEVLLDMIQSPEDFSEIREQISFRKLQELQEEYRAQMEKQRMEIQEQVKTRTNTLIAVNDKKASLCLRIRLLDVSTVESNEQSLNASSRKPPSVVLSIYRPNESYQTNLIEGCTFGFSSLKFAKVLDEEYRLNSGSKTLISLVGNSLAEARKSDIMSRFKRHCSTFEEICSENFNPDFGEFDTVGLVVYIKEKKQKPNKLKELVYIVNENEEIVVLGFWSSLQEQGLEKIIKEGNFISIMNLQWRPMSSRERPIPRGFVQETTEFSLKPKESTMKENLNKLKTAIEDVDEYRTICTEKIFSMCKTQKIIPNSDENEDDIMKTPPLRRHIPPLSDKMMQENETSPYDRRKRNLIDEF